ncbi:MAG: BamA/TamA family outer membrane protein, partial [Thermoanaerobaculia bacterium]
GQPYDPSVVKTDEAVLQAFYTERGFLDSRVESVTEEATPAPPRPLGAAITYRIFEGERTTFGKTVVRGNRRTRFSIIEAQFAHKEGAAFSLSRLIETQQALTRLGVFQRVDLTYFPTDPERKARTVLVTLSEGKPWSLLYGIGAEYDPGATHSLNPRFSLGVSYNNLFGRAMSVGAEGRWSVREQRFVASLRDRSLFRWHLPLSLTVFNAKEVRENFEVKRRGTFIETDRRFSPSVKASLRYQYEIVEPKADDPAFLSTQERQNQKIAISSIGPGLTIDTRSDPIDPKSGYLMAGDFKYAFSFLDADARFLKGLVQAAIYRPFQTTTFAFSLRAGAIQSYGTCDPVENPTCPPNKEIPIAERFYAGGRTTHRAFSLDNLGIEGQTLDSNGVGFGGNGLIVANAEWRIPVFGDFGISLFLDAGNVWADYRDISLSELRTGAGVGLHYLTPVGPLRVEYGLKLDRKPAESLGEFSFSIGYPF